MLYRIVDPKYFPDCLTHVKRAYWPEKDYKRAANQLKFSQIPTHQDDQIKHTQDYLKTILIPQVSGGELYHAIGANGQVTAMAFPFLDRFHELFAQRQWTEPYQHPEKKGDELFRLVKASSGNYSKNQGNFHHYINVVAALARLIIYFSNTDHVRRVLEDRSPAFSGVVYDREPNLRTFKLMLAAFFHDIGKTVTDPRHSIEGMVILARHTTSARFQLHQIVKRYDLTYEFERDDLLFVADLVLYHDHYGTVGTGEDSYLPLVRVIDEVKRYSLKHNTNQENQLVWSRKYLFDLWLLNIADIIVSLDHKYDPQSEWEDAEKAKAKIEKFLFEAHGGCLIHDLRITFDLLEQFSQKQHSDDLSPLEAQAHECSKRHVIERLRRLMMASLVPPIKKWVGENRKNKPKPLTLDVARHIEQFSEEQWHAAIVRAIQSVTYFSEFTDQFSWIGKMDYALGFFQKLAETAWKQVADEFNGESKRQPSGWVRRPLDKIDSRSDEAVSEYLAKTHAQFFAENYVSTVIQILGYLLVREPSINRLRNIEFSDASNRLTPEKRSLLLSLEGPARTRRSIQHILQTIYIF
jgi:hypothetical protein